MAWYDTFFSDDWLYVQRNLHTPERSDADAGAIAELLGLEPGMEVLDAPCGAGRISIPLARRGLVVTGVDFTAELLDDARRDGVGLDVTWEERDMRDLPWPGRFDAAVNVWGSFGYFDDEGERTFASALCNALKPGGKLLIDVPSHETLFTRYQPRDWMRVGEVILLEDRTWNAVEGRMHVEWTFVRDGRTSHRTTDMRLYSCAELCTLLRGAGFSAFTPYGGFDGRPFDIGQRLALVATK